MSQQFVNSSEASHNSRAGRFCGQLGDEALCEIADACQRHHAPFNLTLILSG
jgi:hypothetical protein